MSTSATYAFAPALSDITLQALSRAGIRRTQIEAQHMQDAYMEANLLQSDWSSDIPLLWTAEDYTVSVLASTATYTLPARVLAVQIAYITPSGGSDLVIAPFSETEYAAVPDKTVESRPTSYWLSMQRTPTITLWPTPDTTYTLTLKVLSQLQDATMTAGTEPEVPYAFLDAYCWDLAARLAVIYNPPKAQMLGAVAKTKYDRALSANKSRAPTRYQPDFSPYFR